MINSEILAFLPSHSTTTVEIEGFTSSRFEMCCQTDGSYVHQGASEGHLVGSKLYAISSEKTFISSQSAKGESKQDDDATKTGRC